MPGPYQRNERDDLGRRLDAAARIYHFAQRELEALKQLSSERETMLKLLHAVIITWCDRLGMSEGSLPYQESKLDQVDAALGDLDGAFEPCPGCQRILDHETCWCGSDREHHDPMMDGHSFVPAGCVCHFASEKEKTP